MTIVHVRCNCRQLEEVGATCKTLRDHLLQVTTDLRDVVVDRDFIRQQRDVSNSELAFLKDQYRLLVDREKAYVLPLRCTVLQPIFVALTTGVLAGHVRCLHR